MLQTKALYNLLRLNADEDSTIEAEKWALEDLRLLSPEKLFARLETLGVKLDKGTFSQFAENCDTPEDLTDLLLPDQGEDTYDQFYLCIFELWRQLVPEKQSLSIFCDELDHRIFLYDQEKIESDEPIQDILANLLEVLEENVDAGEKPQEIFTAISNYCAQDLESFIYDYISDLLDGDNSLYAAELIEGFASYVSEPVWFDMLRARLLSLSDIQEANKAIEHILHSANELPLLFETVRVLSTRGDHNLFLIGVKKVLPLLSTQEELIDLMVLVADYYRCLDEEELEMAMQERIDKRQSIEGPLDPADSDLKALEKL